MLDDVELLQQHFSSELREILTLCSNSVTDGLDVVVTSSQWSREVQDIPALFSDRAYLPSGPAHLIIACPIEATVRAGVKMVCRL